MDTVRSCRLAQFTRAAWYRKSTARDQSALALRIRDIAHARPRFGYQRITVMLRREGWPVNRKRVRRLYRLQGLQVRMRVSRRKHMCLHRGPAPLATCTHERAGTWCGNAFDLARKLLINTTTSIASTARTTELPQHKVSAAVPWPSTLH